MVVVDASGIPLAAHTCSASPAEVTLVHDGLEASFGLDIPKRLINDKDNDIDGLNDGFQHLGIEVFVVFVSAMRSRLRIRRWFNWPVPRLLAAR